MTKRFHLTCFLLALFALSLIMIACTQTRGTHRTGGVMRRSVRDVNDVQADRTKRALWDEDYQEGTLEPYYPYADKDRKQQQDQQEQEEGEQSSGDSGY